MNTPDPELLKLATAAVDACHTHHGDPAAVADVIADVQRTRARRLDPLPAAAWGQS